MLKELVGCSGMVILGEEEDEEGLGLLDIASDPGPSILSSP